MITTYVPYLHWTEPDYPSALSLTSVVVESETDLSLELDHFSVDLLNLENVLSPHVGFVLTPPT